MTAMRLQKFISSAGICSRRKAEELIRAGHVAVNGRTITRLGTKVDPAGDRVEVHGKRVEAGRGRIYIALNKPLGVVTSCSHPGEKTVLDLVSVSHRIFPVGRLDKESTGLLLLTNDGLLHHRLSHPSFDHEKEYLVTVDRYLPDGALKRLAAGLPLMGTKTRSANVRRLSRRRFRIVLQEGRNRQIRRMVRKVGGRVTALKRIRVAHIRLADLKEGSWRHLTGKEINILTEALQD